MLAIAMKRPDDAVSAQPGPHHRVVDRVVLHEGALDFGELCALAVPETTRYVVLDLDRTVHRGLNMGELFGWELAAYRGYGPEVYERHRARAGHDRFVLDTSDKRRLFGYVAGAVRTWALPGLHYFVWCKAASKVRWLRRMAYEIFGLEPVRAVQRVPQLSLLHDLCSIPARVQREIARSLFARCADMQVIERDDIELLRKRAPGARIVLSSASPRPVVEMAAELLGVDEVDCTETPLEDDRYASPHRRGRIFRQEALPSRLARPSELRINAGPAKMERLAQRHPDLCEPGVESVGISDTGYGEDHAFASLLTRVIDVNSTSPFPPIVKASARAREVHSASLLTRAERAQGASRQRPRAREFEAPELSAMLAPYLEHIEGVSRRLDELVAQSEPITAPIGALLDDVRQRIAQLVATYNESGEAERVRLLDDIEREGERERALERTLARAVRPAARVMLDLETTLETARQVLAGRSPA